MGFTCFACNKKAVTVEVLLAHVQMLHKTAETFRCTSPNCLRAFGSFKSFKRHLLKIVHDPVQESKGSKNANMMSENEVLEMPMCSENMPVPCASPEMDNDNEHVIETEYNPSSYELRQDISDGALRLASKLYLNRGMTRASVQDVIDGVGCFLSGEYMDFVKTKVGNLMEHNNVPPDEIFKAKSFFDAISNPFEGLDSDHLRIEALKETDMFVSPEPYTIGSEYITKKVNKIQHLVQKDIYGQRVPMGEVLKRFLELPGSLHAVLNNYETLMSTYESLTNIVQGQIWREKVQKYFQGKTVLPLLVYGDDFDPDNIAGSHSGDHEIGAVYYTIACLPPECLSVVENIFLGCFFLSENKIFGNKRIFKPIVDDLFDLETRGIEINGKTIHFCLATVIGDNLALNEMLGFVRGFTANYPCRICRVKRNVLQSLFYADPTLLRTSENYSADLNLNDPTQTGVVEKCIFSRLPSYGDPSKNLYCDVMHDICEGVGKYVMVQIVHYFVVVKKLKLVVLNERIRNFDYSLTESGNVLPTISPDHVKEKKIHMSSSEMLTFIRYFSVMIADYIDEEDLVWKLYLTLREIIEIVTAPFVHLDLMQYLEVLIAEHHEMYVSLFEENLKPKFHFLLHYPDLMLQLGPLVNIWAIRYESKHRPFKQNAHIINSRTNIVLTLATKHQLEQCNRFYFQLPLVGGPVCGPVLNVLRHTDGFDVFSKMLPCDLREGSNNAVSWIEVSGTKYGYGMVIVFGYSRGMPRFGIIKHVVPSDNVVYFVMSVLQTDGFDHHFYRFDVNITNKWKCISYEKLVTFQPLKMVTLPRSGRQVVCTRFKL